MASLLCPKIGRRGGQVGGQPLLGLAGAKGQCKVIHAFQLLGADVCQGTQLSGKALC